MGDACLAHLLSSLWTLIVFVHNLQQLLYVLKNAHMYMILLHSPGWLLKESIKASLWHTSMARSRRQPAINVGAIVQEMT